MEKIKKFIEDYLLIKDVFNVIQWMLSVWVITYILQFLFGDINAPSMSMSYMIKSFMAVSAFSVYFVAAWMILRIFFGGVAKYFKEKTVQVLDRENSTEEEKVYFYITRYSADLHKISNNKFAPECYQRLLFHFSVYFFLVLAIILSGLTLF